MTQWGHLMGDLLCVAMGLLLTLDDSYRSYQSTLT